MVFTIGIPVSLISSTRERFASFRTSIDLSIVPVPSSIAIRLYCLATSFYSLSTHSPLLSTPFPYSHLLLRTLFHPPYVCPPILSIKFTRSRSNRENTRHCRVFLSASLTSWVVNDFRKKKGKKINQALPFINFARVSQPDVVVTLWSSRGDSRPPFISLANSIFMTSFLLCLSIDTVTLLLLYLVLRGPCIRVHIHKSAICMYNIRKQSHEPRLVATDVPFFSSDFILSLIPSKPREWSDTVANPASYGSRQDLALTFCRGRTAGEKKRVTREGEGEAKAKEIKKKSEASSLPSSSFLHTMYN